jgi:hypothetical protein
MAESTMFGNIFDVKAEENAEIRSRALSTAQLQPGRASVYGASQAGGMLMQNLAEMAGMKTVKQEKTELVTSIMQEASKLDMNNPRSSLIIAKRFNEAGLTGLAQKFSDQARVRTVKNREMNLNDDKFRETKRSNKATDEYRSSVVRQNDEDLAFRQEKEATDNAELAAKLNVDATALAREINAGTVEKVQDKAGNTVLMKMTVDAQGNRKMEPFTGSDVSRLSSDVGTEAVAGNVRTDGSEASAPVVSSSTADSSVQYNDDGAIITKAAVSAEWNTGDQSKFKNAYDQYKQAYYRAGSTWDNGQWQLSEADVEAGVEEIPKFYDWVKATIGDNSAEIVDRGLGGDEKIKALLAEDEAARRVEVKAQIEAKAAEAIPSLAKEYKVTEAKLKTIPKLLAKVGDVEYTNDNGLTYAALLLRALEKNKDSTVQRLINQMTPILKDKDGEMPEKKKGFFAESNIFGDWFNLDNYLGD